MAEVVYWTTADLLTRLRWIAEDHEITLDEIAPLHREVARIAQRARMRDPEYIERQRRGYALSAPKRVARRG